jgi:uncharacterized protein (TIGR02265 family)
MTSRRTGHTTSGSRSSLPIWINECNGNPGYIRGVLFAAIEKSGAKNLKIETKSFDGQGATFDVTWD